MNNLEDTTWKNSYFIRSERLNFHLVNNLSKSSTQFSYAYVDIIFYRFAAEVHGCVIII